MSIKTKIFDISRKYVYNDDMWKPETPYNDLAPLPPKGVTLETPAVLKKLVEARTALGELKQGINRIPKPGVLINSIGLREAQISSEIENIVTTGDELFRAFADEGQRTDPRTKEVLRYREALALGFSQLKKGKPLATRMFEELVKVIRQTDEGVRKVPGTKIVNQKTAAVIYTPPEGENVIRKKLSELEQFIHHNDQLDPLVRLALTHYQFEAIHPFTDGNGRTGRIINLLQLVHADLISIPVLFLSHYILKHKSEYYSGLSNVTVKGQWEEWILYILDAVYETAHDTLKRIEDICEAQNEVAETMKTKLPKIYSLDLVNLLFENPYTKIKFLETANIAKRETASRYLEEITKFGLLRVVKTGRDKYFINHRFLDILQRP